MDASSWNNRHMRKHTYSYFLQLKDKASSTVVFIRYLAILDLIVCSFLIAGTTADLCTIIDFRSNIGCKFMYFFDHWIVVGFVFILWVISIDRYRKICVPFGKQLTKRITEVNITSEDENHPQVVGYYCTNSDDKDLAVVTAFFHVVDLVTIVGVFLTFVYTYGRIWLTLRKHKKKTEVLHALKVKSNALNQQRTQLYAMPVEHLSEKQDTDAVSFNLNSTDDEKNEQKMNASNSFNSGLNIANAAESKSASTQFLDVPSRNRISFEGDSIDSTQIKKSASAITVASQTSIASKNSKVKSAKKSERNITIMMFAVSVGYTICFTPHFVVILIRQLTITTEEELSPVTQFLLRSPFWNSVLNPIIFCVLNPEYRKYVRGFFKCKFLPSFEEYSFASDQK
ncbi:5HTR-like protein [Mya arenaria]|uniref:5HTR-like protein n=1 Tax=Mya arenaria TaxID=6604 RepID=A0ABY7F6D9_MYAAR|nr:5HTR-like protein [Mya arenaria]